MQHYLPVSKRNGREIIISLAFCLLRRSPLALDQTEGPKLLDGRGGINSIDLVKRQGAALPPPAGVMRYRCSPSFFRFLFE